MKRLLSIVLVLLCEAAMAQMFDSYYYYPYAEPEERTEDPHSDSLLFYRAIRSSDDLYGRTTDYNLPRVTIRRRGASYDEEQATLLGVRLPYRLFAPLRAVGGVEHYDAGIRPGVSTLGGVGGVREFTLTDALPLAPYEASVVVHDAVPQYHIYSHQQRLVTTRPVLCLSYYKGRNQKRISDQRRNHDAYQRNIQEEKLRTD